MKYKVTDKHEIWNDIPSYEGYYKASNLGRVKSLDRVITTKAFVTRNITGKIISIGLSKSGYLIVSLAKGGIRKTKSAHRLILESFIENTENKNTVNHIDGDKQNNLLSNLEWSTHSENVKHAIRLGLVIPKRGKDNYMYGKTGVDSHRGISVIQYGLNGNEIAKYGSAAEAERVTGVNNTGIIAVCNGVRITAGGFKWIKSK